jgi:hypothetical protein
MSSIWTSIKNTWNWFEGEVAKIMPGLKTYLVTFLGALGSFAAVMQEYISGLPLSEFMTGTQVAIATTVLFTMAFWFHNLSDRTNTPKVI